MKNLIKQIATSLSLTLIAVSLVVVPPDHAQAKLKKQPGNNAKVAKTSGAAKPMAVTSDLPNAENVRSQARRKNVAGAEGFTIDIGTSEKISLQAERAFRRKTKRTSQ
jgi:hypothetical protein